MPDNLPPTAGVCATPGCDQPRGNRVRDTHCVLCTDVLNVNARRTTPNGRAILDALPAGYRPTHGWEEHAICVGEPCSWWTVDEHNKKYSAAVDEAVAICEVCPVQDDCLAVALDGRHWGVWGGTTLADRKLHMRRTGYATGPKRQRKTPRRGMIIPPATTRQSENAPPEPKLGRGGGDDATRRKPMIAQAVVWRARPGRAGRGQAVVHLLRHPVIGSDEALCHVRVPPVSARWEEDDPDGRECRACLRLAAHRGLAVPARVGVAA